METTRKEEIHQKGKPLKKKHKKKKGGGVEEKAVERERRSPPFIFLVSENEIIKIPHTYK